MATLVSQKHPGLTPLPITETRKRQSPGFLFDSEAGWYLLNTEAIHKHWRLFDKKTKPHIPEIGETLRDMGAQQVRLNGRRYWRLNKQELLRYAGLA